MAGAKCAYDSGLTYLTPFAALRFTYCTLLLPTLVLALSACGAPPDVSRPMPVVQTSDVERDALWQRARAVFDARCIVCHGCFDAPCQIKLESFAGVDRGGTKERVYDAARLTAAPPTRLDIDARGASQWRKLGFFPVLPEGEQTNPQASLLLRAVELGARHPLQPYTAIGNDYQLGLDRNHVCPKAEEYDAFAKEHPRWGMPFALPALTAPEQQALVDWVKAGAPHSKHAIEREQTRSSLAMWEAFLNQDTNKGQLVARYIYEHLFFASVRFDDGNEASPPELFRLVRSRTREGDVVEVVTRRPYDDPSSPRVYYRFVQRAETAVDKTLMPYALNDKRLARFNELFFAPAYEVPTLPSYETATASNPFRTFHALPVEARYRFMLEEANFTLMGFIKGPVCRGQVALDVIDDRFFVFFVDPKSAWLQHQSDFLRDAKWDQELPAASGSNALPTLWLSYDDKHAAYTLKKAEFLEQTTHDGKGLTRESVWDGDGHNDNAALTVFRHFDNATVVKGLVGTPTKTMWLIDYPLLERIHYLLVVGFDVFGNVSHQLATRLYMDFLRMEAEAGFLSLLPVESRQGLVDHWYRGIRGERKTRIERELIGKLGSPSIAYTQGNAQVQAFQWLSQRVAAVAPHERDVSKLDSPEIAKDAQLLADVPSSAASRMPESSIVMVTDDVGKPHLFTLVRDSGHTNIADPFDEEERRLPNEDRLIVVNGALGAYPNALFALKTERLQSFVEAVGRVNNDASYRTLRAQFGLQRSHPEFWRISDALQSAHLERSRINHGVLDYTRLDAN